MEKKMEKPWLRTESDDDAEAMVREAFQRIADARTIMTIWQFEEFIRDNIAALGSRGFINSIGEAMVKAAAHPAKGASDAQP
jgi:hypothetical protein